MRAIELLRERGVDGAVAQLRGLRAHPAQPGLTARPRARAARHTREPVLPDREPLPLQREVLPPLGAALPALRGRARPAARRPRGHAHRGPGAQLPVGASRESSARCARPTRRSARAHRTASFAATSRASARASLTCCGLEHRLDRRLDFVADDEVERDRVVLARLDVRVVEQPDAHDHSAAVGQRRGLLDRVRAQAHGGSVTVRRRRHAGGRDPRTPRARPRAHQCWRSSGSSSARSSCSTSSGSRAAC